MIKAGFFGGTCVMVKILLLHSTLVYFSLFQKLNKISKASTGIYH